MINDGGPAFPSTLFDRDSMGQMMPREYSPGMTLRDFFAGQALAGMLVNGSYNKWADAASDAYGMANAMLEEREKR